MAFTMFAIGANLNLLYICHIGKTLEKAHASAHIVDQQHATLLGPTCCVRLRGTTTMLVLVAYI